MENKGLIFIPDISGFTKFINEIEIEHGRLIIQELLEILINSNQMGLEISEIEGDAILFYKFGEAPELTEVYKQVEAMFRAFHQSLLVYDYGKYCQCKACVAAIGLTLKVVTHYGEFVGYNVRQFNKLIGKDIIVAHQLLKNEIAQHEYWLVTNDLLQQKKPVDIEQWMSWNQQAKQTENGQILYHYTPLGPLKDQLEPEQKTAPDFSKMEKVLSGTRDYETDIITLFHAAGDFSLRHKWQQGVKAVEEISHILPRVGMRCRCILENGETNTYSSNYYDYDPEKIAFAEIDDEQGRITAFILEAIDKKTTRLTINYYIRKNLFQSALFYLKEKKGRNENLTKSLLNLDELVSEMNLTSK